MRISDLWQAAFIFLAACGGYFAAAQSWSWLYLIPFPLAYLFVSYSSRRSSWVPPETEVSTVIDEHWKARLVQAEEAAAAAEKRASSASLGLVRAAALAVRTEEDVRALIVSDLHDATAQTLVAVKFLRVDPDVSVDQVADLASQAEAQLRDVMQYQRPMSDQATSLAELLANHVMEMEGRWGLEVEVRWPSVVAALPYPVVVVLFRFAAESLMNVVKHSGALRAGLELKVSTTEVELAVRDQGQGFDTRVLESTDRLGLTLIQHRAEMVGGVVTVDSRAGEGTTSTIRIPVLDPA